MKILMGSWFFIIVTILCTSYLFFHNKRKQKNKKKLPPGPFIFPLIGILPWLRKTPGDFEVIFRHLKCKLGPIISIKIWSSTSVFISSHSLAYQALVQNGAICSDRPIPSTTSNIFNCNQKTITSSYYGPTWRLLRRNLISELLHPSHIKSHSKNRAWVLEILIQRLKYEYSTGSSTNEVMLLDHFKHAIFSLLVLMCFRNKLEEDQIKHIKDVQHRVLVAFHRFRILDFFPRLGKIIFRNLWKERTELRKEFDRVFIPLIQDRIKYLERRAAKTGVLVHDHKEDHEPIAYVDTLVKLELPEEKRKLNYEEMASLCGEFLGAASDTTFTTLQWIMACLVKYPSVQEKLFQEIRQVMGKKNNNNNNNTVEAMKETDLHKMSYLKAVILEGLRKHPPTHFVISHRVTEEMELNGYSVPKNATMNFLMREMGLDPNVWEDPMKFKPERFLVDEEFDITGNKEIKMMPFGVGRRICPGYELALLHLQYFVANLVWHFEWKPVEGDEVDLSEEIDFTITMKYPLRARITPRCC